VEFKRQMLGSLNTNFVDPLLITHLVEGWSFSSADLSARGTEEDVRWILDRSISVTSWPIGVLKSRRRKCKSANPEVEAEEEERNWR
jgi:hypothetical protein